MPLTSPLRWGGGFDIALTSQTAFEVAYRFRHSSNAGLYRENQAFNVNFFQAGSELLLLVRRGSPQPCKALAG